MLAAVVWAARDRFFPITGKMEKLDSHHNIFREK